MCDMKNLGLSIEKVEKQSPFKAKVKILVMDSIITKLFYFCTSLAFIIGCAKVEKYLKKNYPKHAYCIQTTNIN